MASFIPSTFNADKDSILAVARLKGCTDTGFIVSASSYAELFSLLYLFAKTFDCDPSYLDALLSGVTDSVLIQYGIYRNKTGASVTNPKWLINSTYTTVILQPELSGAHHPGLEVVKGSVITNLVLQGEVTVKSLTVASGASVGTLDVETGSVLQVLVLKKCGTAFGTLGKLSRRSHVEDLAFDAGAVFNGLYCPEPTILT